MRLLPRTRAEILRASLLALALGGVTCWVAIQFVITPALVASAYEPREGDILFQSLPGGVDLIEAIEGATHSPFSHCGIVQKRDGEWVVLEAIGPVMRTPLASWIWRGRGSRVAAYRIKPEFQRHIPAMFPAMEKFIGRPYDSRYRFDDDYIYCSELIFKGYFAATGKPLGKVVRLRDLDWQPYTDVIIKYDGCAPDALPLDREMITPRDLAQAPELERVFNWGF